MKNTVCVCFLFLLYAQIVGAVTPTVLKTFVKNIDTVSVDVEQERYIRALGKRIKSTSSAEFSKKYGRVKWKNDKHSFISSKTSYKINDGRSKSLENLPYFSDIKDIIDQVLAGNIDALSEIFDVTFAEKLILTPTVSEIAEQISKIVVDLDSQKLNSIVVYYRNGDSVSMKFTVKE